MLQPQKAFGWLLTGIGSIVWGVILELTLSIDSVFSHAINEDRFAGLHRGEEKRRLKAQLCEHSKII
jgi:hypothetical protein